MSLTRLTPILLTFVVGYVAAQERGSLPDGLSALVGKTVTVGRLPLCEPNTYTARIAYAGKNASVVAFNQSTLAPLPPAVAGRMAPSVLAQMDDVRRGGILRFHFPDGTTLDTCVAMGAKQLAENIELVPGQPDVASLLAPTAAPAVPTAVLAPAAGPQTCPIALVKVASSDGGMLHAVAEALTTSAAQQALDETLHDGASKHFLDVRIRNASDKPVLAVESVVVYADRMGDEVLRSTFVSQNRKPIEPGREERSYAMDREEHSQAGYGQVTVYIGRVRFTDNTFWVDNGSHSCALAANVR